MPAQKTRGDFYRAEKVIFLKKKGTNEQGCRISDNTIGLFSEKSPRFNAKVTIVFPVVHMLQREHGGQHRHYHISGAIVFEGDHQNCHPGQDLVYLS
jgi:hypothetical protein